MKRYKEHNDIEITVLLKDINMASNGYQYGCGHGHALTQTNGHSYRRKDRAVEVKFKLSTMSNKLCIFTHISVFFLYTKIGGS